MKAILTSLIIVFATLVVNAQEASFAEVESKVLEKISLNQWEDVLLAATDLVIADPARGDGYLYTAMAFYHLKEDSKMQKYLSKAKNKADDALQVKIDAFITQMNSINNTSDYVKDAQAYEKSNNPRAACQSWTKAWEEDKSRVDYALNIVGHYVDFKEYENALIILNDPSISNDPDVQSVISKIRQTPTIVAKEGYENAMKLGEMALEAKQYKNALDQFNIALSNRNNDDQALAMRRLSEEEIMWEKARNSSYIEDTEKYADTYPSGKYISEAKSSINSSYISIAKNYYQAGNESGMVDMHNRFLNRFPNDQGIMEIKNLLLDFYFTNAEANYKADNYSSAKALYQQYLVVYAGGFRAEECQTKIKRCDRRLNQRSAGFLLYSYDAQSPIGMDFGRVNTDILGGYMNIKMNKEIFTGINVLYKINDARESDRPGNVRLSGEKREANICVSGGLTFKLAYPLWGYVGGGFGYFTRYEEADVYFDNGDFWETDWLKNSDHTETLFFPEAGFRLKLGNAIVMKYGVMYQSEIIHQFGFGFAL
jgi:tetratricopeptide (TPR) repeat protein